MAETHIEQEAVAKAKKRGWKSFKVSWQGRRGAPDRLFIGHGESVWIEFKRPKKEPTEQQERMADTMRDEGGMAVWWADSVDMALKLLRQYEPGGDLRRDA